MAKTGVFVVGFCLFQLRCRSCVTEKRWEIAKNEPLSHDWRIPDILLMNRKKCLKIQVNASKVNLPADIIK
jgi:hypothetical protein